MKVSRIQSLLAATLCTAFATAVVVAWAAVPDEARGAARAAVTPAPADAMEQNWAMLDDYCTKCHNSEDWLGGVAFDAMTPRKIGDDAQIWEEAVRKLRGRLMPPPGKPQPDATRVARFIGTMEERLDREAAARPNPGSVPLHRLNRTEYASAVEEILGVQIDAAALLPRDDKSAGFDNVADVLKVSPSFMEQYIAAGRQVSLQAVGNPAALPQSSIYRGSPQARQYMHVEGLPLGTRGGMLIEHQFPADGEYQLTVNGLAGSAYVWGVMDPNTLIVTVDDVKQFEGKLGGARDLDDVDLLQAAALKQITERFKAIPLKVRSGSHRVGVTFVQKTAAESNETLHQFVPVAGMGAHVDGDSDGPRIASVEIKGPFAAHGVSDTESRRRVFVCRPVSVAEEPACSRRILERIATQAFRRPLRGADLTGALAFYRQGRETGDFDSAIQKGILAILASPKFLYRAHRPVDGAAALKPGTNFRISNEDLASRLSFFLWSRPPDEELRRVAGEGALHDPQVLEQQVRRLLADRRAHSLVTNFAFQWLNVHGLTLVDPDTTIYPQYTEDLIQAFETELELYIGSLFEADRSVVDLLTDDHTFVNERLALHYGIRSVRGGQFQRVQLAESYRRGLLGKGAFLMTTSYANRTTPVLRGAYVLEKFIGAPPSAPPPNIPAFPETQEGAVPLTVRARLEDHRKIASCNACHGVIDPIGLSLENFNAVGQWQVKDRDAGTVIDASGRLADGTPLHGVDDLRRALSDKPQQFVQTFTENLMTFALGRPVQYFDMPTVRAIVRNSARDDYRLSAIVRGIVSSPAFQVERVPDQKPTDQRFVAGPAADATGEH